jgi:hypothetical protein
MTTTYHIDDNNQPMNATLNSNLKTSCQMTDPNLHESVLKQISILAISTGADLAVHERPACVAVRMSGPVCVCAP